MAGEEDDPGTAFLKQHRTEHQRGVSGSGSRGKDASYQSNGMDGNYTDEYSPTNFNAGGAKRVNRRDKGGKGSGTIGTDQWNQNKYGGDGY